jgi:hypothetical protein
MTDRGAGILTEINVTEQDIDDIISCLDPLGLLFEAIDLSDFLETAITLTSFQNEGKHVFLRDKLNSVQSGLQDNKHKNECASRQATA